MPSTKQTAIEQFKAQALSKYGGDIDSIILFGSTARGDYRKESDIDVLVVVKRNRYDMLKKLTGVAFDLLLKYKEYISVKTLTLVEFKKLIKIHSSFIENVLSEGVVLHGRGKVAPEKSAPKAASR